MTEADESKVTRPTAEAGAVEPVAMKPCPWCGGEVGPVVEEGARFRWRRVTGCCADGPEVRHDTMADDQAAAEVESRQRAIDAWNNRATQPVATEEQPTFWDIPKPSALAVVVTDAERRLNLIRAVVAEAEWRHGARNLYQELCEEIRKSEVASKK